MAKKYYYYVGVRTNAGMSFVTKINNSDKTAIWNAKEKPLEMSQTVATAIAEGLCWNFIEAVVVKSFYKLEEHFIAKEKEIES